MDQLLQRFQQAGTENNLQLTSVEVLNDAVLGLDRSQRVLLVLQKQSAGSFHTALVHLDDVRCSVEKQYGRINAGDLEKRILEHYLERIVLLLDRNNHKPPLEVTFYRHKANHIFEAPEMERKAKHWKLILSEARLPMQQIA